MTHRGVMTHAPWHADHAMMGTVPYPTIAIPTFPLCWCQRTVCSERHCLPTYADNVRTFY